jgi:hypothetical protein
MFHGIVFKVRRGAYQSNPPYSCRVGEFVPGTETTPGEYVKVDQHTAIAQIRGARASPPGRAAPPRDHVRRWEARAVPRRTANCRPPVTDAWRTPSAAARRQQPD